MQEGEKMVTQRAGRGIKGKTEGRNERDPEGRKENKKESRAGNGREGQVGQWKI